MACGAELCDKRVPRPQFLGHYAHNIPMHSYRYVSRVFSNKDGRKSDHNRETTPRPRLGEARPNTSIVSVHSLATYKHTA